MRAAASVANGAVVIAIAAINALGWIGVISIRGSSLISIIPSVAAIAALSGTAPRFIRKAAYVINIGWAALGAVVIISVLFLIMRDTLPEVLSAPITLAVTLVGAVFPGTLAAAALKRMNR
jgi:hypothetical protein